jgi:intergrase/recombinase
MTGHVRRRGARSWEIKFDIGTDALTGKRRIRYAAFKGTKREAQIKMAALITSVGTGSYVEPSKSTVADFVRARVTQWEAAGDISARTAQRYRQLVENQIAPHIGSRALQNAHRVLSKALSDAESDGLVVKNVAKLRKAPKVAEQEMMIVQDVPALVGKLRGSRL